VARLQVLRDGKQVCDKVLTVEDSWDSSFMGAVAIPRAQEHYSALYPKIIAKLVTDADFRLALAR